MKVLPNWWALGKYENTSARCTMLANRSISDRRHELLAGGSSACPLSGGTQPMARTEVRNVDRITGSQYVARMRLMKG